MKISGNLTLTKFEGSANVGEPVAVCIDEKCRGIVLASHGPAGRGVCKKCLQDYDVSFIAVLEAVQ